VILTSKAVDLQGETLPFSGIPLCRPHCLYNDDGCSLFPWMNDDMGSGAGTVEVWKAHVGIRQGKVPNA